ncbi:NACHT, LRR and PYD domains-containing protein 3 [Bombina bombina]|uniref:NACHT, LRR and PYD domains-containing protein 3 n=1 Tax=Bombina bombina TaxID=8345 RepID=UPI00235AF039|nr:NACHT, LRR and PYD domains-containing protein 3 [Bombina bombina]
MASLSGNVTKANLDTFRLHLSQFSMYQLRIFLDYFKNDLIYIIDTLDTLALLRELSYRKIISLESYQLLKEECGEAFSQLLIQDISEMVKDEMLAFWESLYFLQNDHPHPNLLGVLDELIFTGDTLERQISLDESGHALTPDLEECQQIHKKFLMEKTQNLVDNKVPGPNQQHSQSFPISERYLDLSVVSTNHFRKRTQHEVIETGGIHEHYLQIAESNLERIAPNKLFRWCHRKRCVPQSVLVSGVPGVGKTTLMQKFVYDWVNRKLYQRFSFIFFFKFRILNKFNEISLEGMILTEYPHLKSKIRDILTEPEKLLFIFDGLDESNHQIDFSLSPLCSDPQRLENLRVIVVSLVKQTLLKGCSTLITSRPSRLATIEIDDFKRICEIMGFFPKQRQMYFDNFFGDLEMSKKAFEYVRENDILYTFCYIPSYCWIICTVLSKCFTTHEGRTKLMELLPKTITQLFVTFFANILSNHSQDVEHARSLLSSIGWMAENGIMKQILVFDERDLTFFVGPESHLLSSFMVEALQPPNVAYSFFHLTIQEFLAALVHYLQFSPEKLQKALNDTKSFEDGRCEIFLRFLSGLSDSSTRSLLKPYFGELSTETAKTVINFLNAFVKQDANLEKDEVDSKRRALNVFAYLFESRNRVLVSQIKGTNKRFDFSELHLGPMDCTVLAFILESCKEVDLVDLDSCFIQTEGLERIWRHLHMTTDLRLSKNDLKDDDMQRLYNIISNPLCRIERLSLKNNNLTERCCSILACGILENRSLKELDLSKNKLAGPEFEDLISTLSNPNCTIQKLSLQQNKLSDEYADILLNLTKNVNLTHLNIGSNYFTDRCSGQIKKLILHSPSLTEVSVDKNDFSTSMDESLKQLNIQKPSVTVIV